MTGRSGAGGNGVSESLIPYNSMKGGSCLLFKRFGIFLIGNMLVLLIHKKNTP